MLFAFFDVTNSPLTLRSGLQREPSLYATAPSTGTEPDCSQNPEAQEEDRVTGQKDDLYCEEF